MRKYVATMFILTVMLLSLFTLPAVGQETDATAVESATAVQEAPVLTQPELLDSPPVPTEQQLAQMKWGEDNMHLHPPLPAAAESISGPTPGTESTIPENRTMAGQPLVPGDVVIYRWKQFDSTIPAGYKSNVMESSIDGKGGRLFYSGNWFGARSTTKGNTWTYVNAFADYPDFCCDQVVLHDTARDIYLWLRLGIPGTVGGNYENTFKLSVAFANPMTSYWTYTVEPMNTNAGWTNQWWDYPHMQLGADYLYIAWNMFDQFGNWTRSVMLRWPLDELAAGAGFSYNYYDQSTYFTYVPVSGASHYMYFASNWGTTADNLRIWRWDEDSTGLVFWTKTVPAWSTSYPSCGTPNWLGRADMRLLTGTRFTYNEEGIGGEPKTYGKYILAWWWTVGQGSFTYPYIDGAAFYEDTMTLVSGYPGRPYIYGGYCFAYPSAEVNERGDIGMIYNYTDSSAWHKPKVALAIADDYFHAPPGWLVINVAGSAAGPSDNKWGDYNTTRMFTGGTTWLGAAHYIGNAANCSVCGVPLFFSYGRERDQINFWWW